MSFCPSLIYVKCGLVERYKSGISIAYVSCPIQKIKPMILNYVKIALRVLKRNKLISFINLLGLSVGIAAFVVILFYVDYELSFENFQPNHQQIYRIYLDKEFVGTPPPFGRLVKRDFPEVESMTRIGRSSWSEKIAVKVNDHYYYENRFYFVDSTFFQTFDYELLLGDRNTVLDEAFTVVLNKKTALKYFNKIDVIGETIEFNDKTYLVSGIAKDVPPNSHFHFDILSPFKGSRNGMYADLKKYWGMWNYLTYVKFGENVSIEKFNYKLLKHAETEWTEYIGQDHKISLYFQPIRKAHIELIRGNLEAPVNQKYLLIYILIAVIILIVASINFINLSIAGSLKRAKEVGLRKVVGAIGLNIRNQFLSESIFLTIFSLALSFVLIESIIPLLNKWFSISININYFDPRFMLLSLLIIIWVGLISGSYPSFVVSKLQPIKVLKSGFKGNKTNTSLRNVLMIVQFVISICLIISAIVITAQLKHIENINVGFNRHGVVNIPLHQENIKKSNKFIMDAYASNPNIISTSSNSFNITDPPFHQTVWFEEDGEIIEDQAWFLFADEDFFETYEIEMLYGNTFPTDFIDNPLKGYVINKTAALSYFDEENPVGKRLGMRGSDNMGVVIGVIDDFNFLSLHNVIEPLVFSLNKKGYDYISMRINPDKYTETLAYIEDKWRALYPNYPFEIQIVDQEFEKLYSDETKTGSLIIGFTILSVIIASMGLFGINSLVTKYRIREIGVRKVFGASVPQIVLNLSSNIAKLVLIASLIAWPAAYYFMDNWLNNFTYRIEISWYVFVFAGLVTLIISWLTVCSQAIKAANTNPAETLKFE